MPFSLAQLREHILSAAYTKQLMLLLLVQQLYWPVVLSIISVITHTPAQCAPPRTLRGSCGQTVVYLYHTHLFYTGTKWFTDANCFT